MRLHGVEEQRDVIMSLKYVRLTFLGSKDEQRSVIRFCNKKRGDNLKNVSAIEGPIW